MDIDFTAATSRAMQVRELYEQLERRHHGTAWSPQELMIGFLYDLGELGRLVMGAENRWMHEGDLPKELEDKLAENLWWVLVLAKRLEIDITKSFASKMDELDAKLAGSVAKLDSAP